MGGARVDRPRDKPGEIRRVSVPGSPVIPWEESDDLIAAREILFYFLVATGPSLRTL